DASKRRARWIQQLIAAAAAAFAVIALAASVLGLVAYRSQETAQRETSRAEQNLVQAEEQRGRVLAALVNQSTRSGNAATAVSLALEALADIGVGNTRPNVSEIEVALFSSWQDLHESSVLHQSSQDRVHSAAFSSDGRRVVTGSDD